MSASETAIANGALIKLGEQALLGDITDQGNAFARILNAQYPDTRDALLRSFRWKFAMKRASLPADADVPDWGYAAQYQLPADYLAIDQVSDIYVGLDMSDYRNMDAAEWAIEGQKILTDFTAPLPIRYVARIEEVGLFDPVFADLLSTKLAFDCCKAITGSESAKEGLRTDMQTAVRNALRVNAIERPPQPLPDDSWMIGRLGV